LTITPKIKEGVKSFVDEGMITWGKRGYEAGDLEGDSVGISRITA